MTVLSLSARYKFLQREYVVLLHGISIWSDVRGKHVFWITSNSQVSAFFLSKWLLRKSKADLCVTSNAEVLYSEPSQWVGFEEWEELFQSCTAFTVLEALRFGGFVQTFHLSSVCIAVGMWQAFTVFLMFSFSPDPSKFNLFWFMFNYWTRGLWCVFQLDTFV